ncbi:MAG: adenylate/guanylate cyclase domain-containing protein, partial [Acidimicrobiia bacterium]
ELPGVDHLVWVDADTLLAEVEEFLTGIRPTAQPDRVLATVLVTDIVGSTVKAAELGDRRWGDLLDTYHGIVRSELDRHRGREIDTAGDGFLATFDGPARAVLSACAIRDALREVGITIRAGVHTCECELRRDGIAGIGVHIAARVGTAARPGEVLVSRTVKDLVAGSGIRFADRGTHILKGVPEEWELFAAEC